MDLLQLHSPLAADTLYYKCKEFIPDVCKQKLWAGHDRSDKGERVFFSENSITINTLKAQFSEAAFTGIDVILKVSDLLSLAVLLRFHLHLLSPPLLQSDTTAVVLNWGYFQSVCRWTLGRWCVTVWLQIQSDWNKKMFSEASQLRWQFQSTGVSELLCCMQRVDRRKCFHVSVSLSARSWVCQQPAASHLLWEPRKPRSSLSFSCCARR